MTILNTKDKILQGLVFFGYFLCLHAAFFVGAIFTEILNYVSMYLFYTEAVLFLLMPVYGLVLSYYLAFQKKTDINDALVYKASRVFMFISIPVSIAVVFLIYYMLNHLEGL